MKLKLPKLKKDYYTTIILILGILTLSIVQSSLFSIESSDNIIYFEGNNTLNYSTLTLKQKIAQMLIVYEKQDNLEDFTEMVVGGIYVDPKPSKEDFIKDISNFQDSAKIPIFVTADMEGCWNPLETVKDFPTFKEIETEEEAYDLGLETGETLKELGFNFNFAPVVDLEDTIWNCRVFQGTPAEVSKRAISYIKGLEEYGILTSAKHYPGQTLHIKDPHKNLVYATIEEKDLEPFDIAIKNNVTSIMVSHVIVNGSVDSESKPSVVSEKLISELKQKYNGLIVTDEVNMLGVKSFYENIDDMYIDLVKAGNDVILNFNRDSEEIYYMIKVIENAVQSGEISEERIDESVVKILKAKGINLIY